MLKPSTSSTLRHMKAVILAGGGGTRLWPLSTPEKPKQFQKLVSDKTMLEETVARLDFLKPDDIYIAINKKHLALTKELCPQIPAENIIIEPALRDTAPCIGLAAAIIAHRHPGEIMAVIYADHLIRNKKEFQKKLQKAAAMAKKDNTLNIVEVPAETPNINFGYVKPGKKIAPDIFVLDSFTEKPDLETAKKFVAAGYFWNTGIYVWKAETLLAQYAELQPKIHEKLLKMAATGDLSHYGKLEKISIDYAIMEKTDPSKIRIIKANLGWSDIGTWESLFHELAASPRANVTRGPVELTDCEGCLVFADNGKKIASVKLKNMIIVDTPAGQLTCSR